jgi:3-hydroxyacyl-[acyl-carrier-protein] dehydratase
MLRDEIRAALGEQTSDGGELSARLNLDASFPGFRGHFPGQPVLPGVCLVQAALALFEAARSARAHLRRIESAKFMLPVLPGAPLRLTGRAEAADAGDEVLKVRVWNGDRRAAELALRVTFAAG